MSRTGDLKGELINRAYEELRISGLTKQPTPGELTKALDKLENMAEEFRDRDICTGYNFEDEPNANSLHNLKRKYWDSYSVLLANRLLSTFGKGAVDKVDPELLKRKSSAYSYLSSSTAQINQVLPSSRAPIGSGARRFLRTRNFYPQMVQAPTGCDVKRMYIDEIDDFVEHFDAYLNDGETISSYTLEADSGLTVNTDSNTTTDVLYNITATGTSENSTYNLLEVKITITTSDSRKKIRIIQFELREA